MNYTTKATISPKGHTHEFTLRNIILKRSRAKCDLCNQTVKQLNIKFRL